MNDKTEIVFDEDYLNQIFLMFNAHTVDRRIVVHPPGRFENDAEHMYNTILLITLIRPYVKEDLDWARVYEIAAVHDVPEILVGDTFYLSDKTGVEDKEGQAAKSLFSQSEHLYALWREYADRSTPEVIFIRKVQIVQAVLRIVMSKGLTWHRNKVNEETERAFS